MKRVRVVVNSWMKPGVMAFLPDDEDEDFDLLTSNVFNSNSLVLACHPDDECMARDQLAVAQEHSA